MSIFKEQLAVFGDKDLQDELDRRKHLENKKLNEELRYRVTRNSFIDVKPDLAEAQHDLILARALQRLANNGTIEWPEGVEFNFLD